MPCFHPIQIMVSRQTSVGKHESPQVVPCGSCTGCRAEQGRQWAVRMMHESRMHSDSCFVTLTLDDGHLNENRELCAKDFSGFVKRLRKTQEREISFFGCGEYGERNNRPHYHALLFGISFLDRLECSNSDGSRFWESQTLTDVWGRGNTQMGEVTMGSASYVAGYIRKKVKMKDACRANPLTGELLMPEFARMSLRPAIGKRWISKWWRDVYPRDFVVVDGVEAKPPRYYDKWMAADHVNDRRCAYGVNCHVHQQVMEDVKSQRYIDAIELSKYTLNAKEKKHASRTNLYAGRDGV